MREISREEKEWIIESLTDKQEWILFGREQSETAAQISSERPGKSGGDMTCSVCGKSGLTKRGVGLHIVRIHTESKEQKKDEAG